MTTDFLTFVNLIKDELTGEMTLENVDFEKIIKIAESQGMKTLLFSVLKKYNNDGRLKNAFENFLEFEINVTKRVFEYTKTQYEVNKVIKALEKEGISCVILKGDTLSSIYPHSELRMSGDTDILIDIKDETAFNKLIDEYKGTQSAERVLELVQIVSERSKVLKNTLYDRSIAHLTSSNNYSVYWNGISIICNINYNKKYTVKFGSTYFNGVGNPNIYSIQIKEQ